MFKIFHDKTIKSAQEIMSAPQPLPTRRTPPEADSIIASGPGTCCAFQVCFFFCALQYTANCSWCSLLSVAGTGAGAPLGAIPLCAKKKKRKQYNLIWIVNNGVVLFKWVAHKLNQNSIKEKKRGKHWIKFHLLVDHCFTGSVNDFVVCNYFAQIAR